MMFNSSLCTRCMACIRACPTGALRFVDEKFSYDENECIQCRRCEDECYFLARKFSSKMMSVDDVFVECMKDENFYRNDGGVTISGGEPLIHDEFCCELLEKLTRQAISTAVETSGFVEYEKIMRVARYTEMFLYDLKLIDRQKSHHYLGTCSDQAIENLRLLSKLHHRIVIRIPLIPSVNDTDEEFGKMMDFCEALETIRYIHILPFHNIGSEKYEMIGTCCPMDNMSENNSERIGICAEIARQRGFSVNIGGAGYAQYFG